MAHGKGRKKQKREGVVNVGQRVWEIVHRTVPEEALRLTRIREHWSKIAPRWVVDNTWPAVIRKQRLVLNVRDNQWLHELHYWRPEPLARLHAELPDVDIESIEGFLGPIPQPQPEATPAPIVPGLRRDAPLPSEPPTETIDALNAVRDDRLRDILAAARLRMGTPPKSR